MPGKSKNQFLLNSRLPRTQYGAFCWRVLHTEIQVLLITSRDNGRWVIPKGWPMQDRLPEEAAAIEAWEEAGADGLIFEGAIGHYPYDKILDTGASLPCVVSVFAFRVIKLHKRYPEYRQRQRKWFTLEKAAKKVLEPELAMVLLNFKQPSPVEATWTSGL